MPQDLDLVYLLVIILQRFLITKKNLMVAEYNFFQVKKELNLNLQFLNDLTFNYLS